MVSGKTFTANTFLFKLENYTKAKTPGKNVLRWPDTIYLHIGRLFSIQIFDHSAAFDCRDILDAEKGMLEVYQKRTFIEIDTNLRTFSEFSRTWFQRKWVLLGK